MQRDCLDESISCHQLLMKAYAIAYKLGVDRMIDFCSREMDGYQGTVCDDLPRYRVIRTELIASDAYRKNIPVALSYKSNHLISPVYQSIAEIENMDLSKGGLLICNLSAEESMLVCKECKESGGFLIQRRFPTYVLKDILAKVRKTILDWALSLEKEGILGENLVFSAQELDLAKKAQSIYNIVINGSVSNSNLAAVMEQSRAMVSSV